MLNDYTETVSEVITIIVCLKKAKHNNNVQKGKKSLKLLLFSFFSDTAAAP